MARKGYTIILAIIVVIIMSAALVFAYENTKFYSTNYEISTMSYSTRYYPISSLGETSTETWRQGMVSGNGLQGVITSSSPYSDTFTYQNIHFIMPNKNSRVSPDTFDELETVKQAIINLGSYTDDQNYNDSYIFHPGAQLRLTQSQQIIKDYIRYTDYTTAEVGVKYKDNKGEWTRTTFTSQVDGVTITKFIGNSENKINTTISLDDISSLPNFGDGGEKDLQYKKIVDDDVNYIAQIAHYPSYEGSELKDGGYATFTYVIVEGGTKEKIDGRSSSEKQNVGKSNPKIKVSDATAVYLISISDRTYDMGSIEEFAATTQYDLLDELVESVKNVADNYTNDNIFNYDKALAAHSEVFTPMFNSVKFSLGASDDTDKMLSNESLINKQKRSGTINLALAERVYYSGRYAQLCCSGYTTSRLYGMWTGEWNGGWGSKYTMDANVNLQTSALNSSNISISPIGYANFILRQADDWELNATATHGMTDAIQAPVNSDGDKALEIESCYSYPFRYWNAGASWLLEPLYETWQCYGNIQIPISSEFSLQDLKSLLSTSEEDLSEEEIKALEDRGYLYLEEDILLPLLTKSANYWEQLCSPEYYTDSNGSIHYEEGKSSLNEDEKYCIIPSYSPENNPSNYDSPSAANSAIDIAAFNSNLEMLKDIMLDLNSSADVSKWDDLEEKIPEYLYDETGAIKEWACNEFEENNEHRHLSHLYCAWPLDETQNNSKLQQAALQAIDNRASENAASHALVHRSLICARLKDSDGLESALHTLMSSKIYYTSLMTNHHMNARSAYCTDFTIGYTGIVNESLVYSSSSSIEVLPALIKEWKEGTISGIVTKCKITITNLEWDENKVSITLTATQNVSNVTIGCGKTYNLITKDEISVTADQLAVSLNKGESCTIVFSI